MYMWDIWPKKLPVRCRDRAINISKPGIGLVWGNPPTDPLKLQYIKIVYVFTQHELYIQILKEIQRISLLLCGAAYQKPYIISPYSYQQMDDMCTTQ